MKMVMPVMLKLVFFCLIASELLVQGSTGVEISPSPNTFSAIAPIKETPGPSTQGTDSNPPLASPPLPSPLSMATSFSPDTSYISPSSNNPLTPPSLPSAPIPQTAKGHTPSLPPSTSTTISPSSNNPLTPPPLSSPPISGTAKGSLPSSPPNTSTTITPSHNNPLISPPLPSPPIAQTAKGFTPSLPPSTFTTISPSHNMGPPPLTDRGKHSPSPLPSPPINQTNTVSTITPVSVITPSNSPPRISPATQPIIPVTLAPSNHESNVSGVKAPMPVPVILVPAVSPPTEFPQQSPPTQPLIPGESPSKSQDHDVSPALAPSTAIGNGKRDSNPVTSPSNEIPRAVQPVKHSPKQAPSIHNDAPPPFLSSPKSPIGDPSTAFSPSSSNNKHHHARTKTISPVPITSRPVSSPTIDRKGPVIPPIPKIRKSPYGLPPLNSGNSTSPSNFSSRSPQSRISPSASPSEKSEPGQPKIPSHPPKVSPSGSSPKSQKKPLLPPIQAFPPPPPNEVPSHPPKVSPFGPSPKSPKKPLLPPIQAFPPPPPNEDCSTTICTEPYTNTLPGSPCNCVLPMQVGLRLSVALYTFFPLVSELAQEIASGVFMKQSQVRIIGANAANQEPDKTVVLIDLVPLGERFDNTTAFLTFQRFWNEKIVIKASFFGDYEVLYVRYPGLPQPPPSVISVIDGGPYPGDDNNGGTIKPLGVDVQKGRRKGGPGPAMTVIIALSSVVAVVLCGTSAWFFLLRNRDQIARHDPTPQIYAPSHAKPSGTAGTVTGSIPSSASLSVGSSIPAYTGSAKTFSTSDIDKATNNFDSNRILGEGGFGLVYHGVLEDGTDVAVKVLKRDDHQGSREFLAEVEMLSRLHHRNLVKLLGICTEERSRCLVYELIPNGSVDSHLHGIDKETSPLDWASRMKIALGAARGLAYLHEDSSPRVIHRDFKSSNILLEQDFTPKVSDFGLARTALDEENRHISTRVMGTFGYVAPEYAMTGHLLVKSDVYSYGVVLLELLTGRKPVDMSQPPGQENLVTWARPLLTSKEGLESIVDQSLDSDVAFDSVAKVAAIASMCVQPEVEHRPFMGEVVQALKLVCNECDKEREGSRGSSQEDFSLSMDDNGASTSTRQLQGSLHREYSVTNSEYSVFDMEQRLSVSELLSASTRFETLEFGSLRRHSCSGPLRMGRGWRFWKRGKRLCGGGSISDHGHTFQLWPGSY